MDPREQERLDRRIGTTVAGVLRGGVTAAASLVVAGGAVFLLKYGSASPHYAIFRGEPAPLTSVRGIATWALAGHGRGIILLGMLFLMATPVARVAVASWGYTRAREYRFAFLGLVVLGILAWSFVSGR